MVLLLTAHSLVLVVCRSDPGNTVFTPSQQLFQTRFPRHPAYQLQSSLLACSCTVVSFHVTPWLGILGQLFFRHSVIKVALSSKVAGLCFDLRTSSKLHFIPTETTLDCTTLTRASPGNSRLTPPQQLLASRFSHESAYQLQSVLHTRSCTLACHRMKLHSWHLGEKSLSPRSSKLRYIVNSILYLTTQLVLSHSVHTLCVLHSLLHCLLCRR